LSGQLSVAFDGNGNMYIADTGNHRIRKVDAATSIITTVAGNGTSTYSSDGGPATAAGFNWVYGLAVDPAGNIFVCDAGDQRVRRVDAVTGIVTTIAGATWGDLGDNGPASAALFETPGWCAIDGSGNLFITDHRAHRLRKISAATGYVRPVAGVGAPGYSGDGSLAFEAALDQPDSVAVQRNGNLYVTDSGSGHIRKLTAPAAQCTYSLSQTKAAIAGSGGTASVTLTSGAGCAWTAASNSTWITITSALSGTGSGAINYNATSTQTPRTGSLTIAGQRFDVLEGSAALRIGVTHTGSFTQGQTGAVYTVTVSNGSTALATSGVVTVSEQLPAGLTVASMSGTGWNCPAGTDYCNRNDSLPPGASYPAITVLVNVAAGTPAMVTNLVSVSGGGSPGAVAFDPTAVAAPPAPYVISRVAGQAPQGGVQAAALASFRAASIAADGSGNLYLGSNQRVLYKVAQSGLATIIAGTGVDAFSGDGGPATSATISSYVSGIAVDPSGNVDFIDTYNSRIRRVAANGTITTIAGGNFGYSGDGGSAISASVNTPQYLTIDNAGNLYFWETGKNRIRIVTTAGVINTIAGTGAAASGPDGPGTSVALNNVAGLAMSPGGILYIAESGGQKIRTWSPTTGLIATVAGNGVSGYSPDGTAALSAMLANPRTPAFASSGTLYFIDGNRVRKIVNGNIMTAAGNGAYDSTGDGGPPLAAALLYPQGLAFDSADSLYIVEQNDNKVRKVAGGVITTFIGGAPNGDGGAAINSNLVDPATVAVDSNGNLYILDSAGQRVRKVAAGTGIITTFAGNGIAGYSGDGGPAAAAQIAYPTGIACDSAGNVYIAESTHIRKVTAVTGVINTIAGTGTAGSTGDGGSASQATFGYQLGVAVDGAKNIYVADSAAHRVRRIAAATGIITAFAGTGAAGFSGDGGAAVSATMGAVWAIAADAAGNLFIADGDNLRVRKVDAVTGTITTIAGTGTWGSSGDFGPAAQAQVSYISGVAADLFGNVYLGENDSRVRKISAAGTIYTVGGTGTPGYAGDGGPALQALVDFPGGLAVSREGIVYFADRGNVRVRKLTPSVLSPALSVTKTHAGTFVPGQTGAVYTLTVSNSAAGAPTTGTVTVTDNLPSGLTLTSMSGAGWTCLNNSCTRGDVLAQGASYPPITVTVNVASNATSPLVNQATVSGGGSTGASASDTTAIPGQAVLSIAKTHTGNFSQGQGGATYTVTVSNAAAASSGTVTVTEMVPAGLTLVSMAGTGWTCPGTAADNCTRSDVLAAGASYPPITVTVNVAANATSPQINNVSVSGGGSASANASDSTVVLPLRSQTGSDFDGDGTADVLWQDTITGLAQVWLLGGTQGTTVIGAANLTASNPWHIVGVGDFNGDGHPDVVWQDPVSGAAQVWFLGGPQGNVVSGAVTLSKGNSWRIRSIADFNGDGHPDLIWQDPVSGLAQIWFLGGSQGTTLLGAANLTQSNPWRIVGTGDFNGDGHPDVLWQDPVSGTTQIWYLGGAQGNVVTNAVNLTGSNSWRIAAIGDFNRDGHPDVIWQDPVSGSSQVWFLGGTQGTTITGTTALSGANPWRIVGPR